MYTNLNQKLLSFGKHKGRLITQAEDEHLYWIIKNFPESSPLRKTAANTLAARGKIKDQQEAESVNQALLTNLRSCSITRDILHGRRVHAKAVASGMDSNVYVLTALVKMYAKCGSMVDARCVFDSVRKPDVVSWTTLLLGYAESGEGHVALAMFFRMKVCGCAPDSVTYAVAVKACTSLAVKGTGKEYCLQQGREIHSQIGRHGSDRNTLFLDGKSVEVKSVEVLDDQNRYILTALIEMYAKCGSMVEARRVFDSMLRPDVVAWTALILGYAETGEGHVALDLFSRMKACGCAPDSVIYGAALKACTALIVNGDSNEKEDCLERGRNIHSEIGCHLDHYTQNILIDLYSKCGSMVEARFVFDSIQRPDVVSWNALLLGYAENGDGLVALDLFSKMKAKHGCPPNSITYGAALKACASLAVNDTSKQDFLQRGRKIHLDVGFHLNQCVKNALIDMYSKYGRMVEAHRVFDSMEKPDVVSWSTLLLGYADNGEGRIALDLFSKMTCAPNSVTYVALLKACSLTGSLALGRKFHSEISEFNTHVVTCLVDFYAKCGTMVEAREAFDLHSRTRGVSTWNALLAGYSRFGDSLSVFNLFEAMQDQRFRPNAVTFVCMLMCCSHGGLVEKARRYLEAMPVQFGVTPTIMHYTCMVDVLGRANRLNEAMEVLNKMPCNPDVVTWTTLLCACRKWKNVEIGRGAFQALIDMDKKNASVYYVLMAQIYGSKGMWEEQERVLEASSLNNW